MVTSCESSDGHSLDEGVIKQVTGCSPVTCRQIHGKPFTYIPQFKMWFMSNYEPLIKGGDWGIWRRVKKIPWNYTIRPEEKDPSFVEKLKAEAPGILNWMLKGLRRYIELGYKLPPCKAVEDATAQYREDMDIIGRFAGERLMLRPTAKVLGAVIYQSYVEWCKENGTPPVSSRRFYSQFKKRYTGKIKCRDVNRGVQFEGVGLLDDGHNMGDVMF
jgi:putative DNA primase/helicase